jgi:hypothetical protein
LTRFIIDSVVLNDNPKTKGVRALMKKTVGKSKSDIFTPSEANVARRNALTDMLLSVKENETLPYDEMTNRAGFNVREYISLLSSVKAKLIRDHRIVFGLIWGVGIMRLNAQGILKLAESRESSIRRRSKKDIQILISVNRNDLNKEEKEKYDRMLKTAGFMYATTRDETAAERLAPYIHYPKNGPEIGPVLRSIFGAQRRKLALVAKSVA